ncbi:MAG TPA: phosphatidate cytidylyltransferase [Pseudolabrys sp.]|jgi:phosphatidate cytidylyltransferase|nr:phosphatidate cytidylyltransferase [Pseudolabrys sp.]
MGEADPAFHHGNSGVFAGHNFLVRVVSALILAPLALAAAYAGGIAFIAFWGLAALATLWEWIALVTGAGNLLTFLVGAASIAVSALVVVRDHPIAAILVIALGALATAIFAASTRRTIVAAGVAYAGMMLLAPVLLRSGDHLGFGAILFLFAVVWTTDIFGYVFGRAIGGPKLAPPISPNKTWSGSLAGLAGAAIAGGLTALYFPGTNWFPPVLIAILLSAAAQGGDLLESALKRRFGVKDTSQLVPGHGGVMDRLDGFWAAALLGLFIGLLRGGFAHPAQGLLVW